MARVRERKLAAGFSVPGSGRLSCDSTACPHKTDPLGLIRSMATSVAS